MEDISRTKIIEFNSQSWLIIKNSEEKIIDFFVYKKNEGPQDFDDLGELMYLSLKLILSELILHKEDYDKYPIINFKCNFIKKMAELLHNKVPLSSDVDGTNKYIEEFRRNLWGHVKKHQEEISSAFVYLTDIDDINNFEKEIMESKFQSVTTCLGDCLMIVFIENVLRNRELKILENYWK